jgi:hypothetical protein
MEIVTYDRLSEVGALESAWDSLSKRESLFVPSFSQLRDHLEASGHKFRIVVGTDNSKIAAIACFAYRKGRKRFVIGDRKLFELPVSEVSLFGSCILGEPDEQLFRRILESIVQKVGFDLMNVGEIVIDSPLYNAVTGLRGVIVNSVMRKTIVHWLIKLPGSYNEYVSSLGRTTRAQDVRKVNKFEREIPHEFHVIERPEQVDQFLKAREHVGRLTYQWNLGARFYNDEAARQMLIRLMNRKQFRGFLIYVDGKPIAFGSGEMNNGIFLLHTPGFDPAYGKLSPGNALRMWMIRDLIENTDCKIVDFGMGGDDWGYKSRYGNVHFECAWLQVARWDRPYSLFITALDRALNAAKNLASRIIGFEHRFQGIRKWLRQYGHAK